ncbi:16S rRNA (guanine(966)-N(2))-methyltransferase RsmD [Sphingomonas naphthae]|uniref:16S rRNA (Guanine(966)-N(2))-methyltransferase RsmD n=1 Tax=Sphingomonas naphthae TaxID=1813468 RepID=A0ABY7TNY3_9SPHN|nr:16S rRNA (guanine(966)-N(2))-methyltransferase RsmD [Sphingomonas naphthae]WCT74945.1 16S rRNA (guanine(966)-N(2))-methyltransferase RsmD [Sphingomonas naphthae]
MRIIAGQWRGRTLVSPPGDATRPTADRTREGLFSMLASRLGSFEGLKVVDICAGTGALGLEALSRGAAHCTFVERDRAAQETLKANIAKLDAASTLEPRAAENYRGGPFDLILMDAPYGTNLTAKVFANLSTAPGTWASVETAKAETVAVEGWTVDAERVFGKAKITLLRKD